MRAAAAFPDRKTVEAVRKEYPKGTRVELLCMDDPQAPPPGTRGTVYAVDDAASLCVHWDNGSGLNVIYGEDAVMKLPIKTVCYGEAQEWASRDAAMRHFLILMSGSEGSERDRYSSIYTKLAAGFPVCTDED